MRSLRNVGVLVLVAAAPVGILLSCGCDSSRPNGGSSVPVSSSPPPSNLLPARIQTTVLGSPGDVVDVSATGTGWNGASPIIEPSGQSPVDVDITDRSATTIQVSARNHTTGKSASITIVSGGRVTGQTTLDVTSALLPVKIQTTVLGNPGDVVDVSATGTGWTGASPIIEPSGQSPVDVSLTDRTATTVNVTASNRNNGKRVTVAIVSGGKPTGQPTLNVR